MVKWRFSLDSRAGYGCLALVLCAFWSAALTYAIQGLLPFNPAEAPFRKEVSTETWLPQGWKFFTRDPREDWTLIYSRQRENAWGYAGLGPNFNSANLFGLRRAARAQGIELGTLMYGTDRKLWKRCKEDPLVCLEAAPVAKRIKNPTRSPSLCGTIGVVVREQVPWAWGRAQSRIAMPSRVIRFEVGC